MPRARANGLELEYDSFGRPGGVPVLLVMGLSYQMIEWDDDVCVALADRGFWVTRFDNRDVGLSTKLDHLGLPDLFGVVAGVAEPPYTLDDMADDAVGLLDHLGVRAAHLVGVSMGGMIAQLVAIHHPERVLTLTSMMSTVGGPNVVQPEAALMQALLLPTGPTRTERVEQSVTNRRLINGEGLAFDEDRARRKAERAVDRCFDPAGDLRQFAAIAAAPDRSAALGRLSMPTLVIHGEDDPLIPPENGRQTAAALPNARLMMIPRMGHGLPDQVVHVVIDAIVALTAQAAPTGGSLTAPFAAAE